MADMWPASRATDSSPCSATPTCHGNDTERAVQSGLDIAAAVQELSAATSQAIGSTLAVRAAVHRGLLYIDPEQDDVYGLAANVAARYQELAAVGTVVISEDVPPPGRRTGSRPKRVRPPW